MLTQMVWFAVEIHSITHVLAADGTRMPFFREPNHDAPAIEGEMSA